MSAEDSARWPRGWVQGPAAPGRKRLQASAADPARWVAAAAGVLRWAHCRLRQLQADGQPRNADELLAYAQRIERELPGLAADLRAAALRHQAGMG